MRRSLVTLARPQLNSRAAAALAESGEFTLSSFCEHMAYDRVFVTAKKSSNKFFMYSDVSHAAHLLKDTQQDETELIELPVNELEELIESPASHYYYFTAPVAEMAPSFYKSKCLPLWKCISPQEETVAPPLTVWIGCKDVVTQAHYDTEDNLFVQAFGSKKIRFWSPEEAYQLKLFPDSHPRARKSQIDFAAADAAVPEPTLEVTLHAGDSIQIPAFWLHHVETLSPSVSVNLFSPSDVWAQAEKIFIMPTPFCNFTGGAAASSMYCFVTQLLDLLGISDPVHFVHRHVTLRYETLSSSIQAGVDPQNVSNDKNSECAQAFVSEFAALDAIEGGSEAKDVILAHLLELWAVRIAGPTRAHTLLANYQQQ